MKTTLFVPRATMSATVDPSERTLHETLGSGEARLQVRLGELEEGGWRLTLACS